MKPFETGGPARARAVLERLAQSRWSIFPLSLPSSLVHGDLLGQNILIDPREERPFGVIDWEYAMRDGPAYDLAIVTRGKRAPFQQPDGFRALLEAYAACGHAIAADHVRVHELGLAGHWHFEALEQGPGEGRPPEESLALIRRVLKMASAAGGAGGNRG
jgi:aminoglycoside phosphotransferase (APT) family kinase protein